MHTYIYSYIYKKIKVSLENNLSYLLKLDFNYRNMLIKTVGQSSH